MPARETGKQRAGRIPLDYYKRPDRLERWKLRLGGLALVVAVAWPALGLLAAAPGFGWVPADDDRLGYARGPVAGVHAMWEADCNACHTPFTPIRGGGWQSALLGTAPDGSQRCQSCHAGPPHHEKQTPALTCASCHHDHRGREASLVRISDNYCTQCHGNLADHSTGTVGEYEKTVTRFAEGHHPKFRSAATDPGKLKFNHKRHLTPGLATDKGDPDFTLDKIPEAERKRYLDQQPSDLRGPNARVKLRCESCHNTDSADFGLPRDRLSDLPAAAVLPARRPGAYMMPITYENQCKVCHPLSMERKNPDDPRSGLVAIPHRYPPEKIREYLEGHYTSLALQGKTKPFERFVPTRPLPGKLFDEKDEKQVVKVIGEKVDAAEKQIFLGKKTCGECHHYEPEKDNAIPRRTVPTQVPDVWFKHAVFDHSAHRALNCKECHAAAYPDSPGASIDARDVLLPGIDNCLQCHAPRTGAGNEARGGARTDCVECHRYHHGELQGNLPLPGLGARQRGVGEGRFDLKRFLSGGAGAGVGNGP